MRPEDVLSPLNRLSNLDVIYSSGQGPGSWSVAQFRWLDEINNEIRGRVGIRWNGPDNEKGNPTSSGHATWFVLPENLISELVLTYAKWLRAGGNTRH